MFSVAKLIDANPEHHRFLTTTVFAFKEQKKRLAIIQIAVINQELIGSDLTVCAEGPHTFDDVVYELKKILETSKEGTRLIYKEHIKKIDDVDDFAVEHLWPYLAKISVMGTHEDVAEMLRDCFSKK